MAPKASQPSHLVFDRRRNNWPKMEESEYAALTRRRMLVSNAMSSYVFQGPAQMSLYVLTWEPHSM